MAWDCSLTDHTDMSNPPANATESAVTTVESIADGELRNTINQSVTVSPPRPRPG